MLVTGSSGLIGDEVVIYFAKRGHKVFGIDNNAREGFFGPHGSTRWIHESAPAKDVDIGSHVDGFVAHVASFREIEIFDVRPLSTQIPVSCFVKRT